MKLVFLGPPGAGKGTQAKILAQDLGVPHISTGDIFRENIKKETELGKKAKEYSNKGLLVPDEITNEMVKDRLKRDEKGYILDGYPRTIPQAEFLDYIEDIDRVINFELHDKEVVKRISGRRTCRNCGAVYHVHFKPPNKKGICDVCGNEIVQRKDEKPEVVKKRLKVYKKQTEPLIKYYEDKGILKNVDAKPSIDKVGKKVREVIGSS